MDAEKNQEQVNKYIEELISSEEYSLSEEKVWGNLSKKLHGHNPFIEFFKVYKLHFAVVLLLVVVSTFFIQFTNKPDLDNNQMLESTELALDSESFEMKAKVDEPDEMVATTFTNEATNESSSNEVNKELLNEINIILNNINTEISEINPDADFEDFEL